MRLIRPLYVFLILVGLGASSLYAQPVNDDPCGAIELSVNTGLFCTNPPSFTTIGATTSSPMVSCYTLKNDVWFKFTATASTIRIRRNNVTSIDSLVSSIGIVVYRSTDNTCTNLTQPICSNTATSPFILDLSNLTIGALYYVRVGAISLLVNPKFNFTLCVGSPAPVPVNDECANAIALNDGLVHGLYTDSATQSLPPNDCGLGLSTNGALDGWYKFVAITNGLVTITGFEYPGVSTAQPYIVLEQFASCSNTTPVNCDDDDIDGISLDVNAVAGNTYYFRLYGKDNRGYMAIQATGNFPLPIGLNHFNAILNKDGLAVLTWNTGDLNNLLGFGIERMSFSNTFEKIGFVSAKEKTNHNAGQYSYTDEIPVTGKTYYRIREEQVDGSVFYSVIIPVTTGKLLQSTVTIYPNPATDYLQLSLPEAWSQKVLKVSLMNSLGQTTSGMLNDGKLDIHNLIPGIYQLIIVTPENQVSRFRFTKK